MNTTFFVKCFCLKSVFALYLIHISLHDLIFCYVLQGTFLSVMYSKCSDSIWGHCMNVLECRMHVVEEL